MTTVIGVDNLSKTYRLGQIGTGTFANDMKVWWAKVRGRPHPLLRVDEMARGNREGEVLWALQDVSFSVMQGEVLGLIGRNGAGKSTLLKILSRITAPNYGRIRVKGRVSSLLEVGTGFHPELTGRENIYLNGAILGMNRNEIGRKFDEILDFSGVEKFIDTPVKRYSSGMYVRLAFSVAAHLDPEILVVDEVLAVGDAGFQKKCLGKMNDVAHGGRTIVFVSHNMQAIRSLCSRSILLDEGRLVFDGPTEETLRVYHERLSELKVGIETAIGDQRHRRGSGHIRIAAVSVQAVDGTERFEFEIGETIRFQLSYRVLKNMPMLTVSIALRSGITGELITSARHVVSAEPIEAGAAGTIVVDFPEIFIRPGDYPLYFSMDDFGHRYDVVDDLTRPLVVRMGRKQLHDPNFTPKTPPGYFSIPSTLISNSIEELQVGI